MEWVIRQAYSQNASSSEDQPQESRTQDAIQYFKGVGKGVLIKALAVGASAVIPGAEAVIIPLYTAWGYTSIGLGVYNVLSAWQRNKETRNAQLTQFAASAADRALGDSEQRLADYIVGNVQKTGAISEVAKQTGVAPAVYSDMLNGTVTSAISSGFQEFAKFSIGKLVAA